MTTYDEMILRGPDEPNEVGTEDGQPCGRYHEPDEDAPGGYKAQPCKGEMVVQHEGTWVECDTCGEIA